MSGPQVKIIMWTPNTHYASGLRVRSEQSRGHRAKYQQHLKGVILLLLLVLLIYVVKVLASTASLPSPPMASHPYTPIANHK